MFVLHNILFWKKQLYKFCFFKFQKIVIYATSVQSCSTLLHKQEVRQSHESFFLQLEKQATSNCFIIINYHKMSLSTVFAVKNLSIFFLVLITKPLLGKFLNDNTPVFFRTVENYQSPYYRLNCVTISLIVSLRLHSLVNR